MFVYAETKAKAVGGGRWWLCEADDGGSFTAPFCAPRPSSRHSPLRVDGFYLSPAAKRTLDAQSILNLAIQRLSLV